MGATISAARQAVNGAEAETAKKADDALNAMLTIAELKKTVFDERIRNDTDTKMIPVNKILLQDNLVYCSVESNNDKIQAAIKDTLGSFVHGDFLGGLTTVMSHGLDIVLGSYSANQSERNAYVIIPSELGAIMRIDYQLFSYQFTSTDLSSVTKNIVSVSFTVSSVDVKGLDGNTIRCVLDLCYSGVLEKDLLQKLYDTIVKNLRADTKSGTHDPIVSAKIDDSAAQDEHHGDAAGR